MTSYSEALRSGSTTLCRCFRIIRGDGQVMGFTDHDTDVVFEGVTHLASAALSASEASASVGLAPDELDVQGALSAEAITESDLIAGVYDGASVWVYDVDWSNPEIRALLGRYSIGQVERGSLGFRAELRSLAATLDVAEGRVHTTLCDAPRLGDNRCNLDLTNWRVTATVISVSDLEVIVSGFEGRVPSDFDRGTLQWLSGANAGLSGNLRIARGEGERTRLSLWAAPQFAIAPGDTLDVIAGCDRTAATCAARFDNLLNFRGFPHMPGETFAGEYAVSGDANLDGGSRFD